VSLRSQGRVTVSVHIPAAKVEFLDQMISRSGESTSAYLTKAGMQRAVREAKAANVAVPESITADTL
jgi:hypothetical protein